ncbi:family 16 glycosylhydrolase [Agrobacterium larrymoorei]|uniref:family 16 glycosylhydrolase n=1 Tax=Agrobacterium larrymoorei TaxID=160699 RepID=UPI001573277B|nr:family 16 glycosylhydrolase [Agrobacterium larrymoorei]NTJ41822.1 family 16 glycosylhydrolase [Agrobacterium larrymoorei]
MARSVTNALGKQLFYSDTSTGFFSATGSGPDLYGTSRNDSMWGDSSVNVTMHGGSGDDIYYLYSSINRAIEAPDSGTDTINTWMSYTLPDNFENLVVTGDGRHAFGNELDNIITGGTGSQTIDGGAGNDVLIGGGGADTFVFKKGNGTDLITDFGADDTIRLDGHGVTSFDQLMSSATQKGNDLWLNFDNGESIVLANTSSNDLSAHQFKLSLDRSKLSSTFSDEFNSLSLSDGTRSVWEPKFWWAGEQGGSLHTNSEKQWYINPAYQPTASVNPFSVSDGVLTIRAAPTPDAISDAVNGYDYTSGMLTTHPSFSQTYGYFEIRADMPGEQGAWPAFWLLPTDGKWPPELDVIEMRGQNPNTLIMSAHSSASGEQTSTINNISVASTAGFHNYGLLWDEQHITWYFDDVAVAQIDTPADMHDPMYMLVNLAIGGMAGTPTNGLPNGSEMKIDYIHAYSLDDPATANVQQNAQSQDLLV